MDIFRLNSELAGIYSQVGVIVEAMHLLADKVASFPGGYNPYVTLQQQLDSRRRGTREHAEEALDLLKVVNQGFMTLYYLFEDRLGNELNLGLSFWPLFKYAERHLLGEAAYNVMCEALLTHMVEVSFRLGDILVRIRSVIQTENILQ